MHGIIFKELQAYTEAKLGVDAWDVLRQKAGLGRKIFLPTQTYPDAEVVALVTAATEVTGLSAVDILGDFGEFIAPHLLKLFAAVVQPGWKTLDLLEYTESAIHRVVRLQTPGADPPQLRATRVSPDEVVIRYASTRKLCPLATGIIRAAARHFGDSVTIAEPSCMLRGASECQIVVKLAPS